MKLPQEDAALFDSYNARFLEPQEVANTFVPSTHFDSLIRKEHTLVVGPRGSGKTTLLTMLQSQALDAWQSPDAPHYRANIGFTGVFIPTDVSWGKQVGAIGSRGLPPEYHDVYSLAAFTTHILRRFVIAIEYEANRATLPLSNETESEVARELSSGWAFSTPCVSLRSLKYALTNRLNSLKAKATKEVLLGLNGRAERVAGDATLHLSFLDAVALGIEVFDDARGTPSAKWGLSFDELELAPKAIRDTLMESLRSVNERILFKLSLAPFAEDVQGLTDALAASPQNDYTIIQLWFSHKEQSYGFCRALWRQLLATRGLDECPPEAVLGRSVFDTDSNEWTAEGTAYRPKSRLARRFHDLASKDESFAQFLRQHSVDLDTLDSIEPNRRAATVRKATSIVAIRDAVLSEGPTETAPAKRRSREVLDIYSGASALFAMVEGNPRWFKAIIGDLLSQRKVPSAAIEPAVQARAVDRAAKRFRALLRTIPCPPLAGKKKPRGLLSLLDAIGKYFSSELIDKPFNVDPPNSFTVHSRCADDLMESIGQAVNAGAIVILPDGDEEIVGASLRGRRMRISYLFGPFYATLLRAGRSVSLSLILDRTDDTPDLDGSDVPLFHAEEPGRAD